MPAPLRGNFLILCLLGTLSVISPFAIDLYLPAFPRIAADFGTRSSIVALTLSSYFIGMAIGQLVYGPLLDRFGRKRPLFGGLCLFVLASLACSQAASIDQLIGLRFLQALGGCAAGVGSVAMVRDFYPVKDSARIFSLLFLFIGVSPLLAPSVGGLLMLSVGWKMVFVLLAMMVALIAVLIFLFLPEGHQPDPGISLHPRRILSEYWAILRHTQFSTYALAGAFSFAGLFTYVAGSPIIFMENFGLGAQAYGGVFALLTMGFIGGNQLNVFLLRRYESDTLFRRALMAQTAVGIVFLLGTLAHWYGLAGTLVLFFVFLSCVGITYPNAAALALAPFTRNAGSASALLGFLQLGVGALISTGIGLFGSRGTLIIVLILSLTSAFGLTILLLRRMPQLPPNECTAAPPGLRKIAGCEE